ncbi:MAG TPA: DUF4434 domain-containing protein [Candidatus Hydrogenedentes bacterium]|nr:DUF4434 domain-containing protein [Candidatus Hydrogenedentota bacterium]HOL77652.1 DUF4434 domain-containing protein [Candidatus Hydrogenedentota bacterium]HPO87366.1 DUF4434 domain-containing protein [Candidatus Hydrogenedentota bacterium]
MRLSRRAFLGCCGTALGVASWRGIGEEKPLRCPPIISGALRWVNKEYVKPDFTESWKQEVDDERAIGFDLGWLCHVQALLEADAPDARLRELLDLYSTVGMQVLLDTGSTPDWYVRLDAEREIEYAKRQIEMIVERVGDHPAFYGWYVPQEIYVTWDASAAFIDKVYPAIVALCKSTTPKKLVTVSPFFILDKTGVFGDFRYAEPEEYRRYWAALIRRSGFDVVMMQDSGEHFSYVTNEERRPFFEAMREACDESGARFWGNVECAEFECPSLETYVKRYGRVHHSTVKDAPWRPVPLDRLESKLRLAAAYVERIVTWGYVEFCRPKLGQAAKDWYEGYKTYVERVRGKQKDGAGATQ